MGTLAWSDFSSAGGGAGGAAAGVRDDAKDVAAGIASATSMTTRQTVLIAGRTIDDAWRPAPWSLAYRRACADLATRSGQTVSGTTHRRTRAARASPASICSRRALDRSARR